MLSYTFPVVSPAAFIICTTFISGDVLALAISNRLVAWFTSGDFTFYRAIAWYAGDRNTPT